ncbi:hypothetical protein MTR_7g026040 [Medicago truncatula]|uniref:Uncharacterized protein n=1 Tax=Medicago truncatula TaxID=3880 RepID=G7L000_MEDTR|nr:hypothetical protein MTR_7g026040 [Medicago truncatula]
MAPQQQKESHVEKVLQITAIHQERVEVLSTQLAQPVETEQVVIADNLDAHLESQLVEKAPQHMEKFWTTFHMSLHNVSDETVFDRFRLSYQLRSSADPINNFGVIHVADPETWLFQRFKYSHMCRYLYFAVLCY